MTDPIVTQADLDAAAEVDEGAINAARALSARDCGALQSEMREARKAYLAGFLARHRLEGERAGMEKAYRSSAEMCRQMAGTIGARPGSSIYAALEACAERMDEIAIRDTGATK